MSEIKNRLAGSTSPYLLQHASNPVAWYPWGNEAWERAVKEDKPVFLSIGYSACHWCHVMERESFENPQIAAILNDHFVAIKVDREQRPDLDQIYMQAVQMLTGSGGWPMSMFLTPTARPFYGGTYWPPEARWGRPGFAQVLLAVADAWKNRRNEIEDQGQEMVTHLQLAEGPASSELTLTADLLDRAEHSLGQSFEPKYGGFGQAPKFPHCMDLELLIRLQWKSPSSQRQHWIDRTLDGMSLGGIYDHLGGGFSRYSVDDLWLVPHFEKMLYDNGLLASVYLEAYRWTREVRYADVARGTLDYLIRDMLHPEGGFYSAEDADSEGEEGKFYVWTPEEIDEVLGAELGRMFRAVYNVSASGNFEGKSILHQLDRLEPKAFEEKIESLCQREHLDREEFSKAIEKGRDQLLAVRSKRVRPALDDKVLMAWNGLAITALAKAGMYVAEQGYLNQAKRTADFLWNNLRDANGRWWHVWRHGKAEVLAFLDDYAYVAQGLLALYQATQDLHWLDRCRILVEEMDRLFASDDGGYYYTGHDAETLIARTMDRIDHSVPSGNGMAATVLVRLGWILEDDRWMKRAEQTLGSASHLLSRSPQAVGQLLIALDDLVEPVERWFIVCPNEEVKTEARHRWLAKQHPRRVLMLVEPQEAARYEWSRDWIDTKPSLDSRAPTLYLCRGTSCQSPIVGWQEIERQFQDHGT